MAKEIEKQVPKGYKMPSPVKSEPTMTV